MMPPIPQPLTVQIVVSAFLTNVTTVPQQVFANNAQDVHNWRVKDPSGKVIAYDVDPMYYQPVCLTIAPRDVIRGDNQIQVDGNLLDEGVEYTVEYEFFHQSCTDRFVARVAQKNKEGWTGKK